MASAWIRPTICAAMELCDFMRSTVTRFHAASGRSGAVSSAAGCAASRRLRPAAWSPAAFPRPRSPRRRAVRHRRAARAPALARAAAAPGASMSMRSPGASWRRLTAAAGAVAEAHADQVAAVDALEAQRQHGADAQQALALGGPVARRSGAVALARDEHHRQPGVAVARGGLHSGSVWPEGACSVCATGATGAYRLTRLRLWKAARSIPSCRDATRTHSGRVGLRRAPPGNRPPGCRAEWRWLARCGRW